MAAGDTAYKLLLSHMLPGKSGVVKIEDASIVNIVEAYKGICKGELQGDVAGVINKLRELGRPKAKKVLESIINGKESEDSLYKFNFGQYLIFDPEIMDRISEEELTELIIGDNETWRGINQIVDIAREEEIKHQNVRNLFNKALDMLYNREEMPLFFYDALAKYMVRNPDIIPEVISDIGFVNPEKMEKIIRDENGEIFTKLAVNERFLYCLEEQVNHINNELSKSDNYNIKSQIERFTEIYNTWLNKFLKKAIDESSSLSEDSQEMVGSLVLKTVALYKHILLEDSKKLLEYAYEKLPKIMAELTLPMIQ